MELTWRNRNLNRFHRKERIVTQKEVNKCKSIGERGTNGI
jgi:hypothetical protein